MCVCLVFIEPVQRVGGSISETTWSASPPLIGGRVSRAFVRGELTAEPEPP